jgi:hypothetical protein
MAKRITVEIPDALHAAIKSRAWRTGESMRSLIVRALQESYGNTGFVTGPMITGKGKRGPRFPTDETPHDLVFS